MPSSQRTLSDFAKSPKIWGNTLRKACEKARVRSCCERVKVVTGWSGHWSNWSQKVCTWRWWSWRRRLVRIQHGGWSVICRMPRNMRHLQCLAEETLAEKLEVKPEKQPRDSIQGVHTLRSNTNARKTLTKTPTKCYNALWTKSTGNPGTCRYITNHWLHR